MGYENLLMQYGSRQPSAETRVYIYVQDPVKLATTYDIVCRDRNVVKTIEHLSRLIDDLTDYRIALAKRYSDLETMPFSYSLSLDRVPGDTIKYHLKLTRVYNDGTESVELHKVFLGKDRREAISIFEKMKKERPGMKAVKRIEKRSWER